MSIEPRQQQALAEVSRQDVQSVQALTDADLWTFAERASELGEVAWEEVDERLRRWIEVDGKTQTEIAATVGRDQSQVSRRCSRLGLRIDTGKGTVGGRPRKEVMRPHNPAPPPSEGEEVDGEVVDAPADPGPRVKCPCCGHMVAPGDITSY